MDQGERVELLVLFDPSHQFWRNSPVLHNLTWFSEYYLHRLARGLDRRIRRLLGDGAAFEATGVNFANIWPAMRSFRRSFEATICMKHT